MGIQESGEMYLETILVLSKKNQSVGRLISENTWDIQTEC